MRAQVGGYTDATGRVTILVDPNKTNPTDPTQLFLLTAFPATVNAGGSVQVTVFLFTIEGFVVSGGTLAVSLRGVGSLTVVADKLNALPGTIRRLTMAKPLPYAELRASTRTDTAVGLVILRAAATPAAGP